LRNDLIRAGLFPARQTALLYDAIGFSSKILKAPVEAEFNLIVIARPRFKMSGDD